MLRKWRVRIKNTKNSQLEFFDTFWDFKKLYYSKTNLNLKENSTHFVLPISFSRPISLYSKGNEKSDHFQI